MRRRTAQVLGLLFLGACGGGDGASTDAPALVDTTAAATCAPSLTEQSLHLAVGQEQLAGGADATLCLAWTVPEDLDITRFVGTLGPAAGHHALLLARDPVGPDGVAPCDEPTLMDAAANGTFQMVGGVSYESDGVPIVFPSAPVQVGLHIPAGRQLVLDAHFLNTADAPADVCASMDLDRGGRVFAPLEFMTILPAEEYDLTVPAGGTRDVSYDVPVTARRRVAAASTHMHVGGTHATLSAVPAGGGDPVVLHESDEYTGGAPTRHDGASIYVEAGDSFRLECSFENLGATPQAFPDQMCVGGLYLLAL